MSHGPLRQRLRFRSWHRGTREMDLLLGSFADRYLEGWGERELKAFEALLGCGDPDLYNWLTGAEAVPEAQQSPVMDLWVQHRYSP